MLFFFCLSGALSFALLYEALRLCLARRHALMSCLWLSADAIYMRDGARCDSAAMRSYHERRGAGLLSTSCHTVITSPLMFRASWGMCGARTGREARWVGTSMNQHAVSTRVSNVVLVGTITCGQRLRWLQWRQHAVLRHATSLLRQCRHQHAMSPISRARHVTTRHTILPCRQLRRCLRLMPRQPSPWFGTYEMPFRRHHCRLCHPSPEAPFYSLTLAPGRHARRGGKAHCCHARPGAAAGSMPPLYRYRHAMPRRCGHHLHSIEGGIPVLALRHASATSVGARMSRRCAR